MSEFKDMVREILITEHMRTEQEANDLIVNYPKPILLGIMGKMNVRQAAMGLEMLESEALKGGSDE